MNDPSAEDPLLGANTNIVATTVVTVDPKEHATKSTFPTSRFSRKIIAFTRGRYQKIPSFFRSQGGITSLSTEHADEQENGPRCWCCWLTKSDPVTTEKNPLIRACTGCKDLDLQFVHVDCMNRYITSLIQLRLPYEHVGGIPFIPHDAIKEILDQLDSARTAIYHHQPPCARANGPFLLEGNHVDYNRNGQQQTSCSSNCGCPRYDRLDGLDLKCTRCTDPYNVAARRVSSLRVLCHDRVLRVLVAMMTVCIGVLVGATSLIILGPHIDENHRPLTIRPWWNAEPIDARLWAGVIMVIFVSIYLATVCVVLYHSSGYREVMVLPKKVIIERKPLEGAR